MFKKIGPNITRELRRCADWTLKEVIPLIYVYIAPGKGQQMLCFKKMGANITGELRRCADWTLEDQSHHLKIYILHQAKDNQCIV